MTHDNKPEPATDEFVERAKDQMVIARQLQGSPRSVPMHIAAIESFIARIESDRAKADADAKEIAELKEHLKNDPGRPVWRKVAELQARLEAVKKAGEKVVTLAMAQWAELSAAIAELDQVLAADQEAAGK